MILQKKALLAVLMLAALVPAMAVQSQPTEATRAAVEQVNQAAEAYQAFEADMSSEIFMINPPMGFTGHMTVLKPDRMRIKTSAPPPQGNMEIVSDGKTTWTYMPLMNLVQKIDMEVIKGLPGMTTPGQQIKDPSKPLEQLDPATVQLIGEETMDNQLCYIFEGMIPADAQKIAGEYAPEKMKIWVAKDDGISRKIESFQKNGTTSMTITFSNVKVLNNLTDADFVFTPPANAEVVDMTQVMQSLMQNLNLNPEE